LSKIYFISDLHLGSPDYKTSRKRELEFVKWLELAKTEADEVFLVGDVFDFWFEYNRAVPKGHIRCLAKIAELTDKGIPVHWFTGNHDMWIFDYLPTEIGVTIHRSPIERTWDNRTFLIGHGDGLGPGDHFYKFLKLFFASKFCQWAFARLHPNFGIWLASSLSGYSRKKGTNKDHVFHGESEWLFQYCKQMLTTKSYHGFIFGHRHLPGEMKLNAEVSYFNLGDWLHHFTYGVLENGNFSIKTWSKD
jgi:UDP-2,3-diacylglucosamine hydrolase